MNQQRSQKTRSKKRVNQVFELLGKHCADEFAQWQETCDLDSGVVDELITYDKDIIDRAFRVGGFRGAARYIIKITCQRLIDQNKLNANDSASLEEILKLCAEKIREHEKKTAQDNKQKEVLQPLSPQEKQAIMEAFTSVLRVQCKTVENWIDACLNKTQQLVFWRAIANAPKKTALDTIIDLAGCKSDKQRTNKARMNGFLQLGNPLALLKIAGRIEQQQSASLMGYITQLSPVQRDQLDISMNALSEKEQEMVARFLAEEKNFQEFLGRTKKLGLITGEM